MHKRATFRRVDGRFDLVRVDAKFVPDIPQNHRDWQAEDEECTETATAAVALENCQRSSNNSNNNNNSNGANNNGKIVN